MKDYRTHIKQFIDEHFSSHELKLDHSITRATEPHLRYNRVDKFSIDMVSSRLLILLLDYIKQFRSVEIYFAFGYLCIGYLDRDYGKSMRLDAFSKYQLALDKNKFVQQLDEISDCRVDKGLVSDQLSAAARDLDKVPGVVV